MKKGLLLIVFCLMCASYAYAETLLLRTGARVKGSIVFENNEVVVIRDAEGARFQYPRAEVVEIIADEADTSDASDAQTAEVENDSPKKASILLEIAGGAAVIPNDAAGGAFGIDLLVGSHLIGGRHLFIGGGIGYHGLFCGAKYNFLPIQVALRMPFVETRHAPLFGVSLGYGVALSKNYLGGIYAGIDFGYRYQVNPKTAISVVGFAQFQQATISTVETIEESEFINRTGRNFVTPGIKMAVYF